jgi:vacuolar-type H+-ATPase subunit I/STV1
MYFNSKALFAVGVFFIVSCATTHQPSVFPPYFAKSASDSLQTSEGIWEIKELEGKPELNLSEKRRIYHLYLAEMKTIKPGSARAQFISSRIERLRSEIDVPEMTPQKEKEELDEVQIATSNKFSFAVPEIRKEYQEILQLWNKDIPEKGLNKTEEILNSTNVSLSPVERLKFLTVKFRILLEQGLI